MLTPPEIPHPVLLRNALWAILDRIDHDAAQEERSSDLIRLLEAIRCYQPISPQIIRLIQSIHQNPIEVVDSVSINYMTQLLDRKTAILDRFESLLERWDNRSGGK